MRAVTSTPAGLCVADVPEPEVSDGELVQVAAAGICGTDVSMAATVGRAVSG